jgi:hypothetical protein
MSRDGLDLICAAAFTLTLVFGLPYLLIALGA